jgi:hypothetical protein
MPTYKVEVEYTNNKDKTAKIKIKDDSDKIIAKSDAVIPNLLYEYDKYSHRMTTLELSQFIFTNYSNDNCYANIDKLSQFHQEFGQDYIKNKPETWCYDLTILKKENFYSTKIIKATNDAIVLPENMFETLKNILLNKENIVTFQTRKKWFILDQKPCERTFDFNFNDYIELGNNIEKEEKWIKQRKESEEFWKSEKELREKYPMTQKDYDMFSKLNPPRYSQSGYIKKKSSKKSKSKSNRNNSSNDYFSSSNNSYSYFQQIYKSLENQMLYDNDSNSGPSI